MGRAARTQAARWSRFREGVLASLKLKMELSAHWQSTRRLGRRKSALYKPHGIRHQLRRAILTEVNQSRKHGIHTTKRLARRACPHPPCSLARDLYTRRTRTCCRTQHPLKHAAFAFVSYGFVLVRVWFESNNKVVFDFEVCPI